MYDILLKINQGKITVDQAYDKIDEIVDKFHEGEVEGELHLLLGMDNYEWTAKIHGLDLGILAQWRENGWPTTCSACGRQINYKNYGWTITNDELECLDC
jgi:hypothetical protein